MTVGRCAHHHLNLSPLSWHSLHITLSILSFQYSAYQVRTNPVSLTSCLHIEHTIFSFSFILPSKWSGEILPILISGPHARCPLEQDFTSVPLIKRLLLLTALRRSPDKIHGVNNENRTHS